MLAKAVVDVVPQPALLAFADVQQFALYPLARRNLGRKLRRPLLGPGFKIVVQFAQGNDQMPGDDKNDKPARDIPHRDQGAGIISPGQNVASDPKDGAENGETIGDPEAQEPGRDTDRKQVQ